MENGQIYWDVLYKGVNLKLNFISTYEDHIWNEFYNEEEKKFVHDDQCKAVYDTRWFIKKGVRRNMTFVLAASEQEIVDAMPRYDKDWSIIKERRSDIMDNTLKSIIRNINNSLYMKLNREEKAKLNERRIKGKEEFESKTGEC